MNGRSIVDDRKYANGSIAQPRNKGRSQVNGKNVHHLRIASRKEYVRVAGLRQTSIWRLTQRRHL
jgi:hypothetical protein